jgi:50S ribosomal subunit-associated GTPase HflX
MGGDALSFLRRLVRGAPAMDPGTGTRDVEGPVGANHVGDDEVERDRRLLREEAERLDNELIQRQMRYAERSWVPPAQGGDRRSGDRGADEA